MNLQSNVNQLGKTVTQILYNINGEKKTIHGVKTESIEQSQFTRFDCKNGHRYMVNDKLVWLIEIVPEHEE